MIHLGAMADGAHPFDLAGARLLALPSGALHWPAAGMLVVSDLHLGKSERIARRGGALMPPYETAETLARLAADVGAIAPRTVVCLGDSFDDLEAASSLGGAETMALGRLMEGRRWVWVEGNHDPGPLPYGGLQMAELFAPPLTFRHEARPGASGEISGHWHPKAMVRTRAGSVSRPCFLIDRDRVVMPAYGAYTGGLGAGAPQLQALMRPGAIAVLTGARAMAMPMPRTARAG